MTFALWNTIEHQPRERVAAEEAEHERQMLEERERHPHQNNHHHTAQLTTWQWLRELPYHLPFVGVPHSVDASLSSNDCSSELKQKEEEHKKEKHVRRGHPGDDHHVHF